MTASDPHMKSFYPQPRLIAYKRPMNLKDYLIRAKIPPQKTRPKRFQNGMFKCNKPCSICPFVRQQKVVKATNNDNKVQLKNHHTCEDKNVVYIVQCKKCNDQYIGETKNSLRSRFLDHAGYVRRKEVEKSTGHHYNMPGHSLSDMTISVLKRIKQDDPMYRKRRESYHIAQFDLVHNGVNRKR